MPRVRLQSLPNLSDISVSNASARMNCHFSAVPVRSDELYGSQVSPTTTREEPLFAERESF